MSVNLRTNSILSGVLLLVAGLVAAAPGAAMPAGAADTKASKAEPSKTEPSKAEPSKDELRVRLSTRPDPVPLFSKELAETPVAKVGDDTITLRDLAESLSVTHSDHAGATKKKLDVAPLLDRLIAARLIVQEARDMGLDELPEVKKANSDWYAMTLRETLKSRVASTARPNKEDVDVLLREMVREWKVRSVLFDKEAEAVAFAANARDASHFTSSAASAVAAGKAREKNEGEWVGRAGRARGLPQVVAAVEKMKVGDVSVPLKVGTGYAVLLLEDIRYPEVPEARAEATEKVAKPLMKLALIDYYKALTKKYATVDKKLLASIDFKPKRLAALEKDKRPLAQIKGEPPVVVADLFGEIRNQFFHGLDRAAGENKLNPKKQDFFDAVMFRRLLDKEAKEQHLVDSPAFRRDAADFERSVLFSAFVERVILPDVKVDEASTRAYYDAHKNELKEPEFYKLESTGFAKARDAQAACEKLKAGTDVKWFKANADGQLAPQDRSLELDGTTITTSSMPEGLASVMAGAETRDCRIWAPSSKENYAIFVVAKIDARVQPFEAAKETLEKKVFQEKLARAIEDWSKKLREAHKVNVFITGIGG